MHEETPPEELPEVEAPAISAQEMQLAMETLRSEQKLVPAVVAGLIASLIGGGIWAGVTIATEYQIGWMAVGIGFMVGFAMRQVGNGIDPIFGICAAVLSLFGCAVGNLVTVSYFIGVNEGVSLTDVLMGLDFAIITEIFAATFEVIDLLFYGLAAYFGYKYAFREVTMDDVNRALGKSF